MQIFQLYFFRKINSCLLFLGVIRTLVSPSFPGNTSTPSRKAVRQCGLLAKLLSLIMGAGVPEVILTEVILTVSECVRDHQESQNDLSGEFKTRDLI